MKHINILGDVEVTIRNKREETMVRIFINRCTDYIEYMLDEDYPVGQKLLHRGSSHYLIEGLGGMADTMYFMDMVRDPLSTVTIWRYLAREYARRAGEDKAQQHIEIEFALAM